MNLEFESKKQKSASEIDDPTAVSRKRDHIELAFKSQISGNQLDKRFSYEPLLSGHPKKGSWGAFSFAGKKMRIPLWVSSMTGGTELARTINQNLARSCRDFGMGMGLGSCRGLLFDDIHFKDFNVRPIIGDDAPLFANLGIAQLEELIDTRKEEAAVRLVEKLKADGLIIHVNPLQEAMQPEGDFFKRPPLQTIEHFLEKTDLKIIVKEVGQGMGYESLKALLMLPLVAVDFAASGGTNFALLELLRASQEKQEAFDAITHVGHSAEEMTAMTNEIVRESGNELRCKQLIISGGVKNFLDGYYLIEKSNLPAVYGQASGFLRHAREDYSLLADYVADQVKGLELAKAFLKVK